HSRARSAVIRGNAITSTPKHCRILDWIGARGNVSSHAEWGRIVGARSVATSAARTCAISISCSGLNRCPTLIKIGIGTLYPDQPLSLGNCPTWHSAFDIGDYQ